MKIAFVVYRQWGYDIFKQILKYQNIRKDFSVDVLVTLADPEFSIEPSIKKTVKHYTIAHDDEASLHSIMEKNNIDVICMYSWSYIIGQKLLKDFICLCLHPSPVPRFRGGTPIQNQIMNNETESAFTIFKMDTGLDTGDIYKQTAMSYLGTVHDIFSRMIELGTIITQDFITDYMNDELKFTPQINPKKYPPWKRRTPEQSEIMLDKLSKTPYKTVYNLVRGLLWPYPNAFIKVGGKIIFIRRVEKYKHPIDKNSYIISTDSINIPTKRTNIYLTLQDGYAKLIDYTIQ